MAHAAEFSPDFCAAYAWRTADTREVAARYLLQIDEEDVEAYRDGLEPTILLLSTCTSWGFGAA